MSVARNAVALALLAAGEEEIQDRLNEKINSAAASIGKVFKLIEQGMLPESVLDMIVAWAENPTAASTGGPLALGTGTITNDQEAISFLLTSGGLPDGVKNALRRLLVPADPEHIRVDSAGNPTDIATLQRQVAALTTERDTAVSELAKERDENHAGSLAQRLKALSTNVVTKASILAKVGELKTLVAALHTNIASRTIEGSADVVTKIDEIETMVS